MYRMELRSEETETKDASANYFALKTRSGGDMMEHWEEFEAEKVLAVGWEDLIVDPSQVSIEELRGALFATYADYTNKKADGAIASIRAFIGLKNDDRVVICTGYPSNRQTDVHIYAFARVIGPFFVGPSNGRKWRFKHKAVIQPVEREIAKADMVAALGKESLMQTIHAIDRSGFERIGQILGVQINV